MSKITKISKHNHVNVESDSMLQLHSNSYQMIETDSQSFITNEQDDKTQKKKFKEQTIDLDVVAEVKDYKRILSNCLVACLLASNSIVYGSSSSLYACHHKDYKNVIERCCGLFKPKSFLDFCWKLLWFLPLLATFILVCAAIYAIDSLLFAAGYELVLIFAFIGINIVGMVLLLFLPKNRPTSLINRTSFANNQNKTINLIVFSLVFILIFGLSFVVRFAWNQGYPVGSINYNQYVDIVGSNNIYISNNIGPNATIETSYALQILVGGFLCGLVTFIPGISGSFMLSIVGANSYLNTATRFAFAGYSPDPSIAIGSNWAWTTIVIAFIGLIFGFISSCFLSMSMMKKTDSFLNTISFASATSLFLAIFISLSWLDYAAMARNAVLLAVSLVLMFTIVAASAGVMWFYSRKKPVGLSWIWTDAK